MFDKQLLLNQFFFVSLIFTWNQSLQGQNNNIEYDREIELMGIVKKVKYEIPSGSKLETYILKLEIPITVKQNAKWEGVKNSSEIHLNISNKKLEEFEEEKVKVKGKLFHALTIHQIRDLSMKVKKIEKLNIKSP